MEIRVMKAIVGLFLVFGVFRGLNCSYEVQLFII
jgi:hypothetical protein